MEFNSDVTSEIVFTEMHIVKKDFYQKWMRTYTSPGIRDIVDGIHSSALMCLFALIHSESSPRMILWMVLYGGKYLPIETPYGDDGKIFHEFILENKGVILNQSYAVEVRDLPAIIWRKFLGVIQSVPISNKDLTIVEFSAIEMSKMLSFVSSGRRCPIIYTVEMRCGDESGMSRLSKIDDGVISSVDGSKVIVTELRGKKRIEVVDTAYIVCSEKGERDIVYADLNMRQIRVYVRDSPISYIIPSCSDGEFRPSTQNAVKECAGAREKIQGKLIIMNASVCGKQIMKIVYDDTPVNILDDECEITDTRYNGCVH